MEVEVPWAEVEGDYSAAVAEYKKKVRLPGFRRGKAPTALIKRQFGEAVTVELGEELTRRFYDEAMRSTGLTPIDRGVVKDISLSEGSPFSFAATFDVEPDFDLFDYAGGFEVVKPVYRMDEGAVESALEDLRERFADVKEISSGAEDGHILEVDIQEVDSSRMPIIGRRVERRMIKVGEGVFGEEGAGSLHGAKSGEERYIEIRNDDSRAPSTWFKITVHRVEEHRLPALDDSFARRVDSSLKTVDDLRTQAGDSIERRLVREGEAALRRALADAMVRQTEVTAPERLVGNYIDKVVAEAKERGGSSIDEELLRKNVRSRAVWNVRWMLIRRKIIRAEEIEVSESEIDERIGAVSRAIKLEDDKARLLGASEDYRREVREDVLEDKVIELLQQKAIVREEIVPAGSPLTGGARAAVAA